MWLHQQILEAITAGSLQVDAAVAQIDYEISNVNALKASLTDSRDRSVNRLNIAGLIIGGGLGAVSGGLALSQSQAHNSTLAGIAAGALSSGFALAGVRVQKGRSKILFSNSNMLAKFFGRPALPDSQYPQIVTVFLNQVPPGSTNTMPRKAQLIASWMAEGKMDSPHSKTGRNQIERVTSRPSEGIQQSIDDLDNRASMLADLRATISLIKQHLAAMLLSLPHAEAGLS
ncbi:MAG: hypothetical protein JO182_31335 [Acidobacteriaceae bacterium]|nr:hypothetical protein [Acidobacteriaceae bacterium]MBV9222802.1 hypothetical protein [Acidobacteriaceae bacterium]